MALLIAIEGIDGAGTTTQAERLGQWMRDRGLAVHVTREPSDGPVGRLIREALELRTRRLDPASLALLFAADRLDHVQAEIAPYLERGAHVISDRYVYSSLAYQSIDLDRDWVAAINGRAPEPDLTIYLRVDPALAQARRQQRGTPQELFDAAALQERVCAEYDAIMGSSAAAGSWALDPAGSGWIRRDPARSAAGSLLPPRPRRPGHWAVVDGAAGIEAIARQVRALVQSALDAAIASPDPHVSP